MKAAPATVDGLSQCFVGVKPFERALVQLISSAEISLPTCCLHPLLPGEDGICAAEGVIWQSLHAEVHPARAPSPQPQNVRPAVENCGDCF